LFPKRIELVRQITEGHADDGDDDVGNGRPNVPHLYEEFQAEIVDEDIAYGHKEIPDYLRSTFQYRAREADVTCHPETCKESDRELEHKSGNVGRKGDEAKVKDLPFENEMVENIVQHPLQNKVHTTAGRITEQFEAHHLAERGIEKVDDPGQGAFNPKFYVFQG
jgi:hypothetical protein